MAKIRMVTHSSNSNWESLTYTVLKLRTFITDKLAECSHRKVKQRVQQWNIHQKIIGIHNNKEILAKQIKMHLTSKLELLRMTIQLMTLDWALKTFPVNVVPFIEFWKADYVR